METLGLCITVATAIAGSTWVLRSELSKIKEALLSHVADDKAVQADHQARIIKLETRRRR